MLQRCLARDAAVRVVGQELVQQVHPGVTEQARGHKVRDRTLLPLRELGIVVRQTDHGWPQSRRGCAPALENFEDLVNVAATGEERDSGNHLRKDTSYAPHIHRGGIAIGPQQQLGRTVPKSYYLECVRTVRNGREAS